MDESDGISAGQEKQKLLASQASLVVWAFWDVVWSGWMITWYSSRALS